MGAPEIGAPRVFITVLFTVVFHTVGFIDPTDNCPIIFVLNTNKDVCFLEFFLKFSSH